MKKFLKGILTATLFSSMLLVSACGGSNATDEPKQSEAVADESQSSETVTLKVGATLLPHYEILDLIKDDLLAEGVILEPIEFTDYPVINPSTTDGSLDANFFQHKPFLNNFNANSDKKLVSVGPIHIEPMAAYSNSITSVEDLKEGDKVSIPNDPSNGTRALILLESQGLIEIDVTKESLTPLDITSNPLNLEINEMDSAQLPRTIDEFAISIINTNIALEAGLSPKDDSIFIEDAAESPYANILVVREGEENNEAIQKLYKAMTSEKVRNFLSSDDYKDSVVLAF